MSYPALVERTRQDIAALSVAGVRLSPSSRFQQYLLQLEAAVRADGLTVPAGADLKVWVRSLSELDDLHLVISQLRRGPEVRGWQQRVRDVVSGPIVRGDEVKHSRARDIQFELVTAAMFRQARYGVVLDEPDVIIDSTIPSFGIAAKRPRSFDAVQRNVESAARQIRRSGRLGIVALDITDAIAPEDPCIRTARYDDAFAWVIRSADTFLNEHERYLRRFRKSDLTIGLAVHFALPVFVDSPGRPRFGYARRFVMCNWVSLKDPRTNLLSNAAQDLAMVQRAA
jgi:hypothetical protein